MVIVSGLTGTIGAAALWPLLALRRVRVHLETPRDAVAQRAIDLGLRLDGGRTAVTIHAAFGYVQDANYQPACERSWTEVPSSGQLVCRPPRRGVVNRVRLDLRCAAPLGLVWWTRQIEVPLRRTIDIAPQATPAPVPVISQGEGGDRHRPERRSGQDTVRTVRDYVAGDATRLVHWGLTARRDQMTVKELEDPEGALLAIVLDLRGDAELAEKMASRAAGLCASALRTGVEVVLCTAEPSGPVAGRVTSSTAAGRRLARAVPGAPGQPPRTARVVRLP